MASRGPCAARTRGPEPSERGSRSDRCHGGAGPRRLWRHKRRDGVTDFNATKGATFNAHLTDVTAAGQNVGPIGVVTAISGSVSCGTKNPGSGTITITGSSTGGAISGPLTSMLVGCPVGQTFSLINVLTQVGSAPASVEIGGGSGGAYFASISTSR